ncbi:hypothetical protein C8R45DRAFT_349187 [Mycena sanguinolenta]|nr:hypothetical protein C8R45DRAFT_349187 [Mycena sanguinolenta]
MISKLTRRKDRLTHLRSLLAARTLFISKPLARRAPHGPTHQRQPFAGERPRLVEDVRACGASPSPWKIRSDYQADKKTRWIYYTHLRSFPAPYRSSCSAAAATSSTPAATPPACLIPEDRRVNLSRNPAPARCFGHSCDGRDDSQNGTAEVRARTDTDIP